MELMCKVISKRPQQPIKKRKEDDTDAGSKEVCPMLLDMVGTILNKWVGQYVSMFEYTVKPLKPATHKPATHCKPATFSFPKCGRFYYSAKTKSLMKTFVCILQY